VTGFAIFSIALPGGMLPWCCRFAGIKMQIKPLPSIDILKEAFEIKGHEVVWKINYFKARVGRRARYLRPDGYVEIKYKDHKMLAHRVAYALHNGIDPGDFFVDHIDCNPTNNNPLNLRLATYTQNNRNSRRLRKNNTSGRAGVRQCVIGGIEYWKAEFCVSGKNYFIGAYATKEAAIAAREVAEKFAYGEFSPLMTLPPERLFTPSGRA
jgi:hypothetical protein